MADRPLLDGVTVLDLASVGPAARASRWLADWGADVVKVGPVPADDAVQVTPPAYAYGAHRGMRRVMLDLRSDAGRDAFLRLVAGADVVTLHVPLDDTTRNILSAQRLALMKPDAILINAARGGLVDEAALKAMLADGLLAGAAFDVFATEPPDDAELFAQPNFLATPHIGGNAEEAVLAMRRAAIEGLETARLPTADWPAPAPPPAP